jgi:hypothetical protein
MRGIPEEITEVADKYAHAPDGFSIKIRHHYKTNGHPCSINKPPACVVTKNRNGWLFFCHRCSYQGFMSDHGRSPQAIQKAIDRLKEPPNQVLTRMSLPSDFLKMSGKKKDAIPWHAYNWLYANRLSEDDIKRFGIGYSPMYQRVIFPCYQTGWLHPSGAKAKKLIGWIGRHTKHNKIYMKEQGIPKYLTKRTEGIRWLHYHVPTKSQENVVIVEDCVSAIRVSRAMRWHGLAMLTTHIPSRLLISLKGMNVFVWLDADAMAKAVKRTNSLRTLGLNAKFVSTPADPKEYDNIEIHKILTSQGGRWQG